MDWENKVAKINVNQKESEKKLVLKFKSRKRNEYYWENQLRNFVKIKPEIKMVAVKLKIRNETNYWKLWDVGKVKKSLKNGKTWLGLIRIGGT